MPKASPKKKTTTKKTAPKKVPKAVEATQEPRLLSHAEQYYVQTQRDAKTVAQLAEELTIDEASVQGFLDHLDRENAPENLPLRRLTDNMDFKPGTYFMTEQMSMIGDDSRKGIPQVTQTQIDDAVAAKDYELAARLQRQLKASREPAQPVNPATEPHIHVINPKRPVR
jgi:hypothetical protein